MISHTRLVKSRMNGPNPQVNFALYITELDKQEDKERAWVIGLIDIELERIRQLTEYATEREKLEVDAEARSLSLPPAEVTDRLLRQEAHLDRQLYRAMDQLERLQRQRRGENVPPPLNVNLGRRN